MIVTLKTDVKFINFLLVLFSLVVVNLGQGITTNVTYELFRTTLSPITSQQIILMYNPTSSILSSTETNETFSLTLATYPFNTKSTTTVTTEQALDSVDMNISESRTLTQEFYNFESVDMVVVMRLVYEDVYYVNASINDSSSRIIAMRNNDVASSSYATTENTSQLTKQNLTQLVTQCLTIEVELNQHTLLHSHFIAILEKQKTTNYMLPFNLISLKKFNLFVNIVVGEEELEEEDVVKYTNEPFLPTFWNELGQQVVAMPWLPYFSQCTGVKKRIILRDLLRPTKCVNTENTNTETFIELFNPIVCETKTEVFNCVIEEYNVANQFRQPWFYTNENDIFYIHPFALDEESLQNYLDSGSSVIGELTTSMYNERPVLYKKNIGINEKPVEFVFEFDVAMGRLMEVEIVGVRLEANAVRTVSSEILSENSIDLTNDKVSVVVVVNYFTDMDSFFHLHFELVYYVIVPLIITIFFYLAWNVLTIILPTLNQLQTLKLTKLIMAPLIKGLILSLLTMLTFILFFYCISDSTHFSLIATTFDGDDSIEAELLSKYNGRVGLTLLISGLFVLVQGIKQTFKIPTHDEMKIILEDAEEEEELGTYNVGGKDNEKESMSETMTKTSKSTSSRQSTPRHHPLEDILFGIKTLESRRSALTLAYFFILLVFEYNYKFLSLETTLYIEAIIWIIIQPIAFTFIFQLATYWIFKDLIYTQGAMIVYQAHSLSTMVLKSDNIGEFVFYWTVCIIALCLIMPYYQIKLTEFFQHLYKNEQPNVVEAYLLKKMPLFIKHHAMLSYYERGLYYSALFISQLCAISVLPFVFLLIELTFSESRIFSDIFVNSYSFKVIVVISGLLLPILLTGLLIIIQIYDKYFNFGLFKTIQLNHFTFRNRKVKWMSDIFRLNNTIADYLKQYENFHYSSQLYFVLFTLAIAGFAITIGLKIIFENIYICFKDPAMMIILAIIWFTGDILAMIISFLAFKFKFYEKKEELKMRTKLETIEKLLTLKSYTKYLSVKFVKDYFLYNYREWIMKNVDKILTKEIFLEDSGRLIRKMKFYKNLLKRKNLMKKRESVIDVGKIEGLVGEGSSEKIVGNVVHDRVIRESQHTLMSQGDLDREQEEGRMLTITVNGMLKMSNKNTELSLPAQKQHESPFSADSHHPQVIKIPKQSFTLYAKPILYYWFYTAKQNILLKSLIEKVKEEKLQEVCEFCNMDLDLENIEKRDFEDLINEFRVINVGNVFVEEEWISFYRTHQEFITVCLECKEKKLYLQKKKIKNVKYAKVIVLNWLIKCKSQMLHKKQKEQHIKMGRRESVGRVSEEEK